MPYQHESSPLIPILIDQLVEHAVAAEDLFAPSTHGLSA